MTQNTIIWKIVMIVTMAFLVFGSGCTQNTPNPNPNNNSQPTTTCEMFCPTLNHVACDGKWSISGTYPNCNCKFDCNVVTPPQNTTPPQPPANNTTSTTSNQTTSPPPNLPQKTIDQFIKDQLAIFKDEFLYPFSGTYTFSTYSWSASIADVPGNEIPVGAQRPYTDMVFDGRSYPTILGSSLAYLIDKNNGETKKVGGMAIFKGNQSELDTYKKTEMNVKYANSAINKIAYGCTVDGKTYGKDSLGNLITLYVYHCRS